MAKQAPKSAKKAASNPVRQRKPRTTAKGPRKGKASTCERSSDGRFKPGQSGNPQGRPPKDRSLLKHIQEELDAEIQITEGGRTVRLTKRQALSKMLVNKALQGDDKKLNALLRRLPIETGDAGDEGAAIPLEAVLRFLLRKGEIDLADEQDEGGEDD